MKYRLRCVPPYIGSTKHDAKKLMFNPNMKYAVVDSFLLRSFNAFVNVFSVKYNKIRNGIIPDILAISNHMLCT